jgi:hypothetical protein
MAGGGSGATIPSVEIDSQRESLSIEQTQYLLQKHFDIDLVVTPALLGLGNLHAWNWDFEVSVE